MQYINGKDISKSMQKFLKEEFIQIQKSRNEKISLGVFVIGNDPVIESFIKIKKKVAEKIGIDFNIFRYVENIEEAELINHIHQEQKNLDGTIVQLPLPSTIDTEKVLRAIDTNKDVDMLHPDNISDFKNGKNIHILPPVAGAIWKIIHSVPYDIQNKKIVIVGQGKLTGKPFADVLSQIGYKQNKQYFFIDKDTKLEEKKQLLKSADIIVSGVGTPELIKKEDIGEGVFLIDAGTSTANKKLVGDISLDCSGKAKYFSKTPGGVGPVTVAVLYENLWNLLKKQEHEI